MVGNLGIFHFYFVPHCLACSEGQQLSGKTKVQFQVKPVFFQENIRCALTKDQCSANIFLKNVASDRQTEAEKYVF